jgi:hypothetical protein
MHVKFTNIFTNNKLCLVDYTRCYIYMDCRVDNYVCYCYVATLGVLIVTTVAKVATVAVATSLFRMRWPSFMAIYRSKLAQDLSK